MANRISFVKHGKSNFELANKVIVARQNCIIEQDNKISALQSELTTAQEENSVLQSTITSQAETIRLLKEDAGRLAENWEYYEDHCGCCVHCMESQGSDDVHADDCPITLHNQLMNSLEGKE